MTVVTLFDNRLVDYDAVAAILADFANTKVDPKTESVSKAPLAAPRQTSSSFIFIDSKDSSEIRLIYFVDVNINDTCYAVYVAHILKALLRLVLIDDHCLALQVGHNFKTFENFVELTIIIIPTAAARRDSRLLFKALTIVIDGLDKYNNRYDYQEASKHMLTELYLQSRSNDEMNLLGSIGNNFATYGKHQLFVGSSLLKQY